MTSQKCVWYSLLLHGTSFRERTPEDLECYRCDGTHKKGLEIGCHKYIALINQQEFKTREDNSSILWSKRSAKGVSNETEHIEYNPADIHSPEHLTNPVLRKDDAVSRIEGIRICPQTKSRQFAGNGSYNHAPLKENKSADINSPPCNSERNKALTTADNYLEIIKEEHL
jgi:hypothetical protein